MLPPGHVAAGFLTAKALLKIVAPNLPSDQIQDLMWWGIFWSFAPDLDNFAAFFKVKSFYYSKKDNSIHRQFYTHIPLLWMIGALGIYFLSTEVYWKTFGLMLWVGSWTHFILDSIEYGVMWLWPVNKELWALKDRGVKKQIDGDSFEKYWLTYLKYYLSRVTFYCEVIIVISALILIY